MQAELFTRIVSRVAPQARLRRFWQLHGGVSAYITALEIELPDGVKRKWVVRRHGEVDFALNPNIAVQEYHLLQGLSATGVAAPRPVFLDTSGEIFPHPYLVVEFLAGEPDFNPPDLDRYLEQFTTQLVRIHRVDHARLGLDFLPRLAVEFPADTAGATDRVPNPPQLLHGDYWPGNVLWLEGQLAGVIDWEDACLGDPLADIANTRLELLWTFGAPAMQAFTRRYLALTGISLGQLAVWDLWAARRSGPKVAGWGLDDQKERVMQDQLTWFIAQARQA